MAFSAESSPSSSPVARPRSISPNPLHSFRLSLRTAFTLHSYNTAVSSSTPSTPPSSTVRSRSNSPFSFGGFHSARSPSATRSPTSPRTRSRSRTWTPVLRRRPSTIDIALEEERMAHGVESRGLELMEPRPMPVTPVMSAGLGLGLGFTDERLGPGYVGGHMGGIFEVMEGEA